MGDALMNWEAGRCRWRKKYKGQWLQISPAALGGTTATDTRLAADQWYKDQQARIDGELALEKTRTNEWWEHRRELESIQSAINVLTGVMRGDPEAQSVLVPKLELFKRKEASLKQALQKSTPLPPLEDQFRNPLNVSPDGIEERAVKETTQEVIRKLRETSFTQIPEEELQKLDGYVGGDHPQLGMVEADYHDNDRYFRQVDRINGFNKNLEESTIEDRVRTEIVGAKDERVSREKQELGLIESEFDRGMLTQLVKEAGAAVPESRKLDYHIAKFLEYQQRRHAEEKIGTTRLIKITRTIKTYREWCPIINGSVERIGTKDHIDAYYKWLGDRKIAGEIGADYANQLFGAFKLLIDWLVDEEVLKTYPVCMQRRGKRNRYMFPVDRPTPEGIPLGWVHTILDAANPCLRLCVLLTLNCGFGAAEIGQIRKSEYNPATGRITRKRSKTNKSPSAPKVCYKLWGITKELLDQEIEKCKKYPKHPLSADCLLSNRNGMPLWYSAIIKGRPRTNCSIGSVFDKLLAKLRKQYPDMPKFTYYQFRGTSANLIYNEPKYRMYHELFLAHSPHTVAERHYVDPDATILDDCLAWLHDKIFGSVPPSE